MTVKELKDLLALFDENTEIKILMNDTSAGIDGLTCDEKTIFLYGETEEK